MDLVGRPAGGCQPPRGPLAPEEEAAVRAATEAALAAGLS
jgi:1-pyrroline-4-hydroxy-2-carboxylate deaminase